MNSLIIQVFYAIFSGAMEAFSISNEILPFGSPLIALFCLVPIYLAVYKSKSYIQCSLLISLQILTVHLISSFWLANFHGYGVFTLGASAFGTALQGFLCGFIFYMFPRTLNSSKKLEENAGKRNFSLFKRMLWFSMCWVLWEYVKSTGDLAYPWGALFMGAWKWKIFTQIADVTGVFGISFLFALFSSLTAEFFLYLENASSIQNKKTVRQNLLNAALFTAACFSISTIYGVCNYFIPRTPTKHVNTVIVQQNLDPWDGNENTAIKVSTELTEDKIKEFKKQGYDADLVVWSEGVLTRKFPSASKRYKTYPDGESLSGFISRMKTPFIIGGITTINTKTRQSANSAILFDKNGEFSGSYNKMQLVPFAERTPDYKIVEWFMDEVIGMNSRLKPGFQYLTFKIPVSETKDFDTPLNYKMPYYAEIPLNINGTNNPSVTQKYLRNSNENPDSFVRFSTPICFEDAFPPVCRQLFNLGSELFVNITNDSWSKTNSAEIQHFIVASYRAIEFRTTMVRCSNSGYSVVIDPSGRVIEELPLFREAASAYRVPVYKHKPTVYSKYGDWFIYICLTVLALYTLFTLYLIYRKPLYVLFYKMKKNFAFEKEVIKSELKKKKKLNKMTATAKINFRKSITTFVSFFLASLLSAFVKTESPFAFGSIIIFLTASLCGGLQGAGCSGLYLIAGMIFPVYPKVSGLKGISCLTGEYGGFIWGIFITAIIIGFAAGTPVDRKNISIPQIIRNFIALVIGLFLPFITGSLWNCYLTEKPFAECFNFFLKSYILSEGVKFFITFVISIILKPVAGSFLYPKKLLEEQKNELLEEFNDKHKN